jgi:hypothetical protein
MSEEALNGITVPLKHVCATVLAPTSKNQERRKVCCKRSEFPLNIGKIMAKEEDFCSSGYYKEKLVAAKNVTYKLDDKKTGQRQILIKGIRRAGVSVQAY